MAFVRKSIHHDPRINRRPSGGLLARVGRGAMDRVVFWSGAVDTLARAVAAPFTPGKAAAAVVRSVTFKQLFFTGVQGLPYVTVTALILGSTLMLQGHATAPGVPGEAVGQLLVAAVLRELAPLVTAMIVASRSGTAIATELGNMRAGLEDAGLRSLGVDPQRYMVQPRLVAMIVSVLVLTVYFAVLAVGGCLATAWLLGAPSPTAIQSGLALAINPSDLFLYLIKGTGCGVLIGWLCCHFGLQVTGSSTEVPLMTGKAVIASLLGCVVFNFAVTIGYYAWVSGSVG